MNQIPSSPGLFVANGWKACAEGLLPVVARCRPRGYEPTSHNETGSYVEAPAEIEQVEFAATCRSKSAGGSNANDAAESLDITPQLTSAAGPTVPAKRWNDQSRQKSSRSPPVRRKEACQLWRRENAELL